MDCHRDEPDAINADTAPLPGAHDRSDVRRRQSGRNDAALPDSESKAEIDPPSGSVPDDGLHYEPGNGSPPQSPHAGDVAPEGEEEYMAPLPLLEEEPVAEAPEQGHIFINIAENCSICFEPLIAADDNIATLDCGHAFHRRCIARAYQQDPRCPLCRANVALDNLIREHVVFELAPAPVDEEAAGELEDGAGGWAAPELNVFVDIPALPDAPPVDPWGPPVPNPPIYLNANAAVGHIHTVPRNERIRVLVQPTFVILKWFIINIIMSVILSGGFNFATVIISVILSVVLQPCFRMLLQLWRRSDVYRRIALEHPIPVGNGLTTAQMNILISQHLEEPVHEVSPAVSVTALATVDSLIQRSATSLGLTNQVVTGNLSLYGTYLVPRTEVDVRPSNYIGTLASANVAELCVSHLDDVHNQRTSLVFWSPEMVNQVLSSSRYIPAEQRSREIGPRASRITDQQIQSPFYSMVQAGSAHVANIRASGFDIVDSFARGTILDFPQGSPSTPFTASDIVPKMGAPFLLSLGMMLTSSYGLTSIVSMYAFLLRCAWVLVSWA
jgi:hypothetical protein